MSAHPRARVLTVVTADLRDSHTEITELMRNVRFINGRMNGRLASQQDNSASVEETAVYFFTTY